LRTKFAGYYRDAVGQDYAMARNYSSVTGSFWSPDPSSDNWDASNPGSWNLYAYTNGDPVNFGDPNGLQTCGQVPIEGGAFNGMTVSQVMTGTSGQDLMAQLIWHEGGTIYQSDLANPGAYEQDLAAIGTAIMDQWDVDDKRLTVYQNGQAVCPLGQCLDRSLQQVIIAIAKDNSGSIFDANGNMRQPDASKLSGVLNTNVDSGPLVLDISGNLINLRM
jgi:RHS repeat-associated protein